MEVCINMHVFMLMSQNKIMLMRQRWEKGFVKDLKLEWRISRLVTVENTFDICM